jgi:hypothetical protein
MTDRMARALLRLLIALARHLAYGSKHLLEAADEAEAALNERARIS